MQTLPPTLVAATVLGLLAAALALSTAVVASLRGGRSRAAARRLAPVTVAPALVAVLLGTLTLGGTLPTGTPLAGVLVVSATLAPVVRSLWETRPAASEPRTGAHAAD